MHTTPTSRLPAAPTSSPTPRRACTSSQDAAHVSVLNSTAEQETLPAGAQHGSTGDWETRAFFPRIGPAPPERCRCEPTSGLAVPLRTQLLRNLSRGYPAVRVLPLHSLLQPRHGWHQQDCKVREQARAAGSDRVGEGCDCTHYCYSPLFWRVYFRSLLEQLS